MWLRNVVTTIVVLLVLAGCGFTPMYSKHSQQGRNQVVVREALETKVDPVPGRSGQILRMTLMDGLNPHSAVVEPKYRLTVTLEEKEVPVGIQQDRRITRYNVVEEVTYSLKTINGNKLIDKGHVRMIGSYDAVDSDFATFSAKQDTVERVMKEIGIDIHNRVLAAFLKQNNAGK